MATDLLRDLSLAISLINNDPTALDARLAWKDYAWVEPLFYQCIDVTADGGCHAVHQKWDWKRNQWVDLTYWVNAAKGDLTIQLKLTNNDPKDADDVCVTALMVDKDGRGIFAFHQNWHSTGKSVLDKSFTYKLPAARWQAISRVVVGSKQCRGGPHQDDDTFAGVKTSIGH